MKIQEIIGDNHSCELYRRLSTDPESPRSCNSKYTYSAKIRRIEWFLSSSILPTDTIPKRNNRNNKYTKILPLRVPRTPSCMVSVEYLQLAVESGSGYRINSPPRNRVSLRGNSSNEYTYTTSMANERVIVFSYYRRERERQVGLVGFDGLPSLANSTTLCSPFYTVRRVARSPVRTHAHDPIHIQFFLPRSTRMCEICLRIVNFMHGRLNVYFLDTSTMRSTITSTLVAH